MEILLISSALDSRANSLSNALKQRELDVLHKWTGANEWPLLSDQLVATLILEDRNQGLLDSISQARRQIRRADNKMVPIFVVPKEFAEDTQPKCMVAGATHVCSPDETDERLVAEIQSTMDLGLMDAGGIRMKLLQPFVSASIEAMQIMGGINCRVNRIYRRKDYDCSADISALIYLIGQTQRVLAVSFKQLPAYALTAKVLAVVTADPGQELIRDCMGEMVNIIAGQVKGRFVHTEFEFDISTPSIVSGAGHEIYHRTDLPSYVMTFSSDIGDFALQLCLRDCETRE